MLLRFRSPFSLRCSKFVTLVAAASSVLALWPWSPSETFRLVFFCGIVVSMEGSNTFVREVIAALRPVLPAETLDHVSFSIETGQLHKALI